MKHDTFIDQWPHCFVPFHALIRYCSAVDTCILVVLTWSEGGACNTYFIGSHKNVVAMHISY